MKIIIDDAAISRALGKSHALWVHKKIQEIREFFEIPETEPEPKYDDTAERDYAKRVREADGELCGRCLRNRPTPGLKSCASCRILNAAKYRKQKEK